ncbi:MAG: amino acid permease [Rhodospirillales bacterium]|nr:amino acid permease [Rhodospirillales bacterium]MBT4041359.1 amino acid permease [Rhodospirillales bacterium]MBT4626283.1 amino acid permease [Rhodospirillales bacterium]MBT5353050.1 amino acid permease [Rhodospirillales bacterium]MBT5520527.1 amino acid permease [Rhodospirillales bacterium]
MLALYGLGTTIGAGIYSLIGEVTNIAGMQAPAAFLMAAIMASLTAFSFAELASRFPRSAGEAFYIQKAFELKWLSLVIGLMVVFAGVVSAAAIANAFVGYLHEFLDVSRVTAIILIIGLLGIVAAWGISESVIAAGVVTIIEIGGLCMVIWAGGDELTRLPEVLPQMVPSLEWGSLSVVMAGAVLAFFAFIGFEDLVNVAEETKNPAKVLPMAIVITLVVTTVIYVLISVIAVLAVPLDQLTSHEAPLVLIYESKTGQSAYILSMIGIIAVLNGALIQIIMASRVLYGLASQRMLPGILATVNARTRTPVYATGMVVGVVLVLALGFGLAGLAQTTSLITLAIFALVNGALIRIRLRDGRSFKTVSYPLAVPILGLLVSLGFLAIGIFG